MRTAAAISPAVPPRQPYAALPAVAVHAAPGRDCHELFRHHDPVRAERVKTAPVGSVGDGISVVIAHKPSTH
jgi:hypothetical protein